MVGKIHRLYPLAILVILVVIGSVGCVSTQYYEQADRMRDMGDYALAYSMVVDNREALYTPQDRVLYNLNAGILAHFAGELDDSITLLEDAERSIEENFTKSVSAEIGTFIVNDTVRDYAGEDYEDIYVNLFLALNQYHNGDLERMMVELRRADNKLNVLSRKYEIPLQKASGHVNVGNGMVSIRFSNSALIHYLSLLGYRAMGKVDDVRYDTQRIADAFATQPAMYPFPMPQSIKDEKTMPEKPLARVNFIAFSGQSPEKLSEVNRIFIGNNSYIKIDLPYLWQRYSPVADVRVVLDNGETCMLEKIEDIGAIATETFQLRKSLIEMKTIARATAKSLAGSIAESSARDVDDGNVSAALSVFSLFMQVFQEVSEVADLRISRYFPAVAHIGGISIPSGTYAMRIEFLSAQGKVLYSQRIDPVRVESRTLNLIEGICPF